MVAKVDILECSSTRLIDAKHLEPSKFTPTFLLRLFFLSNSAIFKNVEVRHTAEEHCCGLSGHVSNLCRFIRFEPYAFACYMMYTQSAQTMDIKLDLSKPASLPKALHGTARLEFTKLRLVISSNNETTTKISVNAAVELGRGPTSCPKGLQNLIFSRMTKNFVNVLTRTHV